MLNGLEKTLERKTSRRGATMGRQRTFRILQRQHWTY